MGILNTFKEFKALIEKYFERKIKALRVEIGIEYTLELFKEYCISLGIKREFIVPCNPQQNEVAERKNKSIVEAAESMIFDQNLDSSLWAEASRAAAYIQNRCPHSHLDNKTPEETFTRHEPDIIHLIIFGSPVYIHVPKEKRTKLEPSGRKGIFVGYSETSKAYITFISGQRQIELSRDVILEEDITLKRAKNYDELENHNPTINKDVCSTPET